ncbi:MAG: metallophosphoesterase [Woeseiaceae bacterium]|jgi:Icc protein|nr:metallophosphoesterase [Woeseiaceae bacterium]
MMHAQDMDTLRVLQVTDPHLFASHEETLRGCATWQSLNDTVDHYLARDWRADIVYLTGDLVQDDSREAYRNLRAAIDRLHLPVYLVPGNHDVPRLMAEELPDYRNCTTLDAVDWRLIGIDTREEGSTSGRIGAAELARLATLLESAGSRHVAIFLHHPPVDVDSAWLDGIGLLDRDAFLAVVGRHPAVRLIVFGHVHQVVDHDAAGLRIVGTPSTGRQFRPRSHEFAIDDRPPAYRRLELSRAGDVATEIVWVKDD